MVASAFIRTHVSCIVQTKFHDFHLSPSMASTTASCSSLKHLNSWRHLRNKNRGSTSVSTRVAIKVASKVGVFAVADDPIPNKGQKAAPGEDTRIHWDNEDEGWVGVGGTNPTSEQFQSEAQQNVMGQKFSDLLNNSSDSHYQFLGISAAADLEEIKSAYRRLSKEYHPDTTSLPLRAASDKFLKLRQVYDVLSNEESRRFYDWSLAQETASRQADKLRLKLEDPYQQDLDNWESVPDMVDRLGGKNLELSDQAMSALSIDVAIIIFAICSIIYVLIFQVPYY